MSCLEWEQTSQFRIESPKCECCGGGKVRWFPVIAGYLVPSEFPLADRYGVCGSCREEWDAIWERGGLA